MKRTDFGSSSLRTGTETVLGMLVYSPFSHLTRLVSWLCFI